MSLSAVRMCDNCKFHIPSNRGWKWDQCANPEVGFYVGLVLCGRARNEKRLCGPTKRLWVAGDKSEIQITR